MLEEPPLLRHSQRILHISIVVSRLCLSVYNYRPTSAANPNTTDVAAPSHRVSPAAVDESYEEFLPEPQFVMANV